jgi:hypothetical protein
MVNMHREREIEVSSGIGVIPDQAVVFPSNVLGAGTAPGRSAVGMPVLKKPPQTDTEEFAKTPLPLLKALKRILASKPLRQEIMRCILSVFPRESLEPHPMRNGIAVFTAKLLEGTASFVGVRACCLQNG